VTRTAVEHRDEWVLLNLRKLRRELYPAEHAREHADLLARAARLRRRLFLAQPPAVLTAAELAQRRAAFADDVQKLDARLQAREGAPRDATGGLARLQEMTGSAAAAGDPALADLQQRIAAVAGPAAAPLSTAEFEARRDELLQLLDAVAGSAQGDAERRARAAYLRLQLLSLAPGEPAREGLLRARRQREEDVQRAEDEAALRAAGIAALGNPEKGLREVEDALAGVQGRLQELKALDGLPEARPPDRARKEEALRALAGERGTSGCARCHEIAQGTLRPVTASRRVLTLADFRHEPHLGAAPANGCASCHAGVETSEVSADLHVPALASCRQCHNDRAQRQDCQLCHRYHPPPRL
jgi:hypothetical protein